MINCEKQEHWKNRQDTFLIDIVHWTSPHYEIIDGKFVDVGIKNHWNVYAYIYPNHPLFDKFLCQNDEYWRNEYISNSPLHGCSLYRKHESNSKITAIQFGSDYGHIDDDYIHVDNIDSAYCIQADAELLFEYIKNLKLSVDEVPEVQD